ncbi:conserved hypothetical protein [Verrucomicrobia bacterium]|nr:conserved hypothetical protein [Verrucomicrobiota bacterium]
MSAKESPVSPPAQYVQSPVVEAHQLQDDGTIPNNPKLPLLIYQGAVKLNTQDGASIIEQLLEAHQWGGSWRNGIYPYVHYHSTAHEVLAVFSGSAKVQFGGKHGVSVTLHTGDVVIIPAGVAHKKLGSSQSFAVVGAYPKGQEWDMCYGKTDERPEVDRNIASVALPAADPIYGAQGPLLKYWGQSAPVGEP